MPESGTRPSQAFIFGEFTLDLADERLRGPDGPIKLGHKAFRLLVALIEQEGRLLTKDAIFSSVWDGTIVGESALTSVVKELRRALGDGSRRPRFIESVYGRGYRFIAGVERSQIDRPIPTPERRPAIPAGPADSTVTAAIGTDDDRPPLVVVSEFNDSAVRDRHPYCAAELREEVLAGLARFREIQPVAEDRSDAGAASRLIGQRGYRLNARLLPEGDGVRVIARASRLADGLVVWAETLSLLDTGTAGSVERIVRRIVGSALPAVDQDLFLGLSRAGGAFYDRYLLAKRRSLTAASFADAKAAAGELEALIAERPDFPLAYPPLVRLYNTDFGYTGLGASGERERARALALARAGLAADRGNVHAFTVLGFCYLYHRDDELARNCLEQALVLNPFNAVRLNEVASGMMFLGDFDRARALLQMSLNLQPFPDDSYHTDSGLLALLVGDFDRAHRALDAIVRSSIWAELYLALAELGLGLPAGQSRFGRWRERVERAWHSGETPASAQISALVRTHHPFSDGSGEPLFAMVDEAFGQVQAQPLPRAPGRE